MDNLSELLRKFPERRILVVGDIIVDKYIIGDVTRVCPEAPVPAVRVKEEFYRLGGSGNVASNIRTLIGASQDANNKVCVFSFAGEDNEKRVLEEILSERGIEYHLETTPGKPTSCKTRIIGNNQQIARVDYEDSSDKHFSAQALSKLVAKAEEADLIVVSDYAKGTITPGLFEVLENYKRKIIVGSKPKNKDLYHDVRLVIPNRKESCEMSGCSDYREALHKLRKELRTQVLITLGEDGMILFSDKETQIPTYAKEVYDVNGAGDTVLAAVALSLSSGSSLEEAAILANHSAGIAVGRKGTYSVKLNELESKILSEARKLLSLDELKETVNELRRKKQTVVWTNGCFDILHIGHIDYLRKAKSHGNVLIVGIDSDDSVRKAKGPTRPVNNQSDRAGIISSLGFVDFITVFEYGHAEEYLKQLHPDIYVKGGDYAISTINQAERKIVEGYGGKIVLIPRVYDTSTTKLISSLKK